MGVNTSKNKMNKKLQIIDFGSIMPLGLYSKCDEYDLNLVKELILNRKISPFYKGLSNPLEQLYTLSSADKTVMMNKDRKKKRSIIIKRKNKIVNEIEDYEFYLFSNEKQLHKILYSNSVECPICFLFYPANINFTRCCDQPICTECFVQIKKGPADYSNNNNTSSSSASHIVCPYCMTEEFGIIYYSPTSVTGIMEDSNHEEKNYQIVSTTSGLSEIQQSKRKSIESNHPDVVLIDHVRLQHRIANKHNSDMSNNSSNLTSTAHSLQFWFQSRPNATSLERYLASIRLDTLTQQDIMVIESIRQSIIEREQERLLVY